MSSDVQPDAKAVPAEAFRACVGEFATGVTVVLTEHDHEPAGMTLNSFTSISLEPPLVLISLEHGARTLAAVRASGRFAVSVLRNDQRDAALEFARAGGAFPANLVTSTFDGFLIVAGAVASHHCAVEQVVRAGDHDLVIGRVVGITHAGGEPLLFRRGRFGGMNVYAESSPDLSTFDVGGGW